MTTYPCDRNIRLTFRSRRRFDSILSCQKRRRERGTLRPQRGQPCQKQPSTKIATRFATKQKSGRPGTPTTWRFQPRKPYRMRYAATRISVERLFFARIFIICADRCCGVRGSYRLTRLLFIEYGSARVLKVGRCGRLRMAHSSTAAT